MPELAYRHWNDRICVSQTHGASHMMAMRLGEYAGAAPREAPGPKIKVEPDASDEARARAKADVIKIAQSAIQCNTNVIGGSGVFRELVVLAQGRAGPWGAADATLTRSLARVLVVFKSTAGAATKHSRRL